MYCHGGFSLVLAIYSDGGHLTMNTGKARDLTNSDMTHGKGDIDANNTWKKTGKVHTCVYM